MKTCGEWPWEHRICTDCRQAAGIYFSPQYCANTCILPGCASAASLQRGFQSAYIGWLKAFSDNQVACAAGFYGKLVVSQAENQRLREELEDGKVDREDSVMGPCDKHGPDVECCNQKRPHGDDITDWLREHDLQGFFDAAAIIDKLRAENQRLREAVQHGIDACCTHPACLEDDGCPLRKALKGDGS